MVLMLHDCLYSPTYGLQGKTARVQSRIVVLKILAVTVYSSYRQAIVGYVQGVSCAARP